MATYIQGVQDAVQGLRPPDPNLQFDAQLLATRQAKYDQAHSKLSKMYGTILNSGLSREDNIAAREEFFKLIDSDLHKIAGMDLSKDSNVSKAQNVFKQIYTNDYLVKDMVWTKNFQDQMQRAESFKNCRKPEDCGGQYWDEGVKYMQYKRQEFQNATRDESLGFQNVEYIPYNNIMEKAMKDLEASGISIKYDKIDGRYKYTYQNGEVVKGALVQLYNGLYKNNPQMMDMYKVMAYNERKDWITKAVASGQYNSLEEAGLGYYENQFPLVKGLTEERIQSMEAEREAAAYEIEGLLKDRNSGQLTPAKEKRLETLLAYGQGIDDLLVRNEEYKYAIKNMNNQTNMNILFDEMDFLTAATYLDNDILQAADTYSHKNEVMEITPDEYALAQFKFNNEWALAEKKQEWAQENIRLKAKLEGDKASNIYKISGAYESYYAAKQKLDAFGQGTFNTELKDKLKDELDLKPNEITEIEAFIAGNPGKTIEELKVSLGEKLEDKTIIDDVVAAINENKINLKKQANSAAFNYVEYGGDFSNIEFKTENFDKHYFDAKYDAKYDKNTGEWSGGGALTAMLGNYMAEDSDGFTIEPSLSTTIDYLNAYYGDELQYRLRDVGGNSYGLTLLLPGTGEITEDRIVGYGGFNEYALDENGNPIEGGDWLTTIQWVDENDTTGFQTYSEIRGTVPMNSTISWEP